MSVCAGLAVVAWLAALTVFDIREHRLPNVLTLPGAVVALGASVAAGRGLAAVVGALLLTGGYLVVHLVSPKAMGAGDVKLALGLGALTGAFGAQAWVSAALGAPLLTAVCGVLIGRRALPHGPAMCLATAVAVVVAMHG
jgi:leader peptidase (prepilin peptidase)/N-methyltransferase